MTALAKKNLSIIRNAWSHILLKNAFQQSNKVKWLCIITWCFLYYGSNAISCHNSNPVSFLNAFRNTELHFDMFSDFCNRRYTFVIYDIILSKYTAYHLSSRPLFASSLLGIIRTLLEQTQQIEMQTLGCSTLVDFINNQVHLQLTSRLNYTVKKNYIRY